MRFVLAFVFAALLTLLARLSFTHLDSNELLVVLTGVLALFTFGLVVVGWLQRDTLETTLNASREIERAYISVAHTPDGIHPQPDGRFAVTMQIANAGNTPATVHDGRFKLVPDLDAGVLAAFQPPPINVGETIAGGFLVRGKSYKAPLNFTLDPQHVARLQAGKMWLVAAVEYTDRFGRRHRAGYARHVHPTAQGNNLEWDETAARYNYDIEIDEQGHPTATS